MTPGAEKWSEAIGALGILGFTAALAWALPGYVALAFISLVVALGAIGVEGLARAALYGVQGVQDKLQQQEDERME